MSLNNSLERQKRLKKFQTKAGFSIICHEAPPRVSKSLIWRMEHSTLPEAEPGYEKYKRYKEWLRTHSEVKTPKTNIPTIVPDVKTPLISPDIKTPVIDLPVTKENQTVLKNFKTIQNNESIKNFKELTNQTKKTTIDEVLNRRVQINDLGTTTNSQQTNAPVSNTFYFTFGDIVVNAKDGKVDAEALKTQIKEAIETIEFEKKQRSLSDVM